MGALLTVNVGNTRVGLGLFDLAPAARVPQPVSAGSFPLPKGQAFSPEFRPAESVEAAVVASVNPACDAAIAGWIDREFGIEPRRFPQQVPSPLENRCEKPEAVGADRLANAVAAREMFGAACIIVDAGTAVTVDAVSAEGAFLGGAIFPGVALSARALAEGAALLPKLDITGPGAAIGRSTAAAAASGTLRGLAGAIDRLIRDIGEELGGCEHVIATGGDSDRLVRLCETRMDVDPHLALAGLAVAYLRFSAC